MRELVPGWDFTSAPHEEAGGGRQSGSSQGEGNITVQPPDSGGPSSWNGSSMVDMFPDIFGALSDLRLHTMQTTPHNDAVTSYTESTSVSEHGESSRRMKIDATLLRECRSEETESLTTGFQSKQENRPKRTRSAEVHNTSEKRRRERIREKLKTLQEMIPNCNKTDRASMLNDAIEYTKALQLQVHMMCPGRGPQCQAPYFSPAGFQSMQQVPHLPPFVIRPGMGMGLGFGPGYSMFPVPAAAAGLHLSLPAAAGLPLMSAPPFLPVPHVQVPFATSQQLSATDAVFNHPNQGESSSQHIQRIHCVPQSLPTATQSCTQIDSSYKIHPTQRIPPHMGGNVVAEASSFYEGTDSVDSGQKRRLKCRR